MLMKSSKILTLAVAFAVLASGVMPIFGIGPVANAAAEDTVVKIGLLNPLTGPIAQYAPPFTTAAEVAIADLNAANSGYDFQLDEQDSGCNGDTAATAASTLVSNGVVGIAGAACSGATLGAMPVARDAGIPMVSYASTSPAVTSAADSDFLFRVVPSDEQQGQAMAAMAMSHGWTNPAIIYMTNDYGAGLADAFEVNFGSNCTKIGYNVETQTDFQTQVDQIAAAGCDSLIMVSYATDGAMILETMAANEVYGAPTAVCSSGCPYPVMGADGIADMSFLGDFTPGAAGAAALVIATKPKAGFDTAEKTAFNDAFVAAGGNTSGIYINEVYDAISIIGKAKVAADAATDGSTVRDNIRALGSGAGYTGASGVHVFDTNGDVVGSGYDICQFNPIIVDGAPSLALACNAEWGLLTGLSYDNPAIKIGLLNPLTGPIAEYSMGFTIAANVAIGFMNTIQPLNFQFALEMADSGCNGDTAAASATTLINAGVVGIAGAACSGATLGAMPVARDAGIPMVSYASTSPALTTADDSDFLYRVVPSDEQQGQALASVVTAAGYTNPAILYMTNDYGAGFADAFEANFGSNCTKIGYNVETQESFSTQIEQIGAAGCDSLVMVTYATDGAKILEEAVTQNLGLPVFGGDGIADAAFANAFTDASAALPGVTATKPGAATATPFGAMFDGLFAQTSALYAYNHSTAIYARETFDAVAAIGLATAFAANTPIATDGPADMLGLLVGGADAPFVGASGIHIFDSNGDVVGSGYDVCTFAADLTLDCHSSWGLISGLNDEGIAKKPVRGCTDSTANNFNADANEEDNSCTFDVEPEPEPEPEPEEEDEVPGFGLMSAIAAIGVVLILRRRL